LSSLFCSQGRVLAARLSTRRKAGSVRAPVSACLHLPFTLAVYAFRLRLPSTPPVYASGVETRGGVKTRGRNATGTGGGVQTKAAQMWVSLRSMNGTLPFVGAPRGAASVRNRSYLCWDWGGCRAVASEPTSRTWRVRPRRAHRPRLSAGRCAANCTLSPRPRAHCAHVVPPSQAGPACD